MKLVERERVAQLWLLDGSTLSIGEDNWPSYTHGDDHKAVSAWVEITGLKVTIKTVIQTTLEPIGD